jgi:hypothetical protein
MKSLLNQLESDEAILLMYVADELPLADRAAVERRLQSDAPLRDQLDAIRGLQDSAFGSMRAMDAQRLPGQGAGSRQVVRVMQRWNAGRALERAAQPQPSRMRLHIPSWLYPVAAAAIVVVGFAIWGMNVEKHSNTENTAMNWSGGDGGLFDAPPADTASPVAEQYAKLEEALDDSAGLTAVDDQVSTLSDWGVPILPKDVVEQ